MKLSIVTPTFNSEKFISETIESVISQRGEFSIEYIIIDNCSTDGTASIVKEYQHALGAGAWRVQCNDVKIIFISESDHGMYDAVNKGFSRATGDIYAWINADDIYLPGAFASVTNTLEKYSQVRWVKGITSYIDENSVIYSAGECHFYIQKWIREGVYGPLLYFIQQDSVFWRAELWRQVCDELSDYTLAGDYFIWRRFAEVYSLYSLNAHISCFRRVPGQKSEDLDGYWAEGLSRLPVDASLSWKIKAFQRVFCRLPHCVRPFFQKLFYKGTTAYLIKIDDGEPRLYEGTPYQLSRMLS